ncbi:hypothetical protein BCR33DRAFT_849608 [Rhizoclosmatium globosum]|uniref:G-protein coupled receptors family 3 profile domain-containing protein n=1 Tax=Rhizoclosmatium globosum TaxID=329046 RepID=A0A1Y2CG02_9FUNG|nr:hypothetical protein BCR33DRAFT_849608 [Rhizoclosmatium globosum]|eukprot:ORY45970.1 hypothetical protein BCR33DRAFT_849608 [Rhizoclosmatium globosum]
MGFLNNFYDSYLRGALYVNPICEVEYRIAQDETWSNETWGIQLAKELLTERVDVLWGAAGGLGSAAIFYAASQKIWVISVDTNESLTTFANKSNPNSNYIFGSAVMALDKASQIMVSEKIKGNVAPYLLNHGEWAPLIAFGKRPMPLYSHSMTFLGNNNILIFGGQTALGTTSNQLFNLNFDVSDWQPVIPLSKVQPPGLTYHCAGFSNTTNELIVFGGVLSNNTSLLQTSGPGARTNLGTLLISFPNPEIMPIPPKEMPFSVKAAGTNVSSLGILLCLVIVLFVLVNREHPAFKSSSIMFLIAHRHRAKTKLHSSLTSNLTWVCIAWIPVLVNLALLIAFSRKSPYQILDYIADDGSTWPICQSRDINIWMWVLLTPNALCILGTVYVGFETRNVNSRYNEARLINSSAYVTALSLMILIGLGLSLKLPSTQVMMTSLICSLTIISVIGINFIPKVMELWAASDGDTIVIGTGESKKDMAADKYYCRTCFQELNSGWNNGGSRAKPSKKTATSKQNTTNSSQVFSSEIPRSQV